MTIPSTCGDVRRAFGGSGRVENLDNTDLAWRLDGAIDIWRAAGWSLLSGQVAVASIASPQANVDRRDPQFSGVRTSHRMSALWRACCDREERFEGPH